MYDNDIHLGLLHPCNVLQHSSVYIGLPFSGSEKLYVMVSLEDVVYKWHVRIYVLVAGVSLQLNSIVSCPLRFLRDSFGKNILHAVPSGVLFEILKQDLVCDQI